MWRRGDITSTPSGDDNNDDDDDDDDDDDLHDDEDDDDDPDVQAYHLFTVREYGGLLERAGFTQVSLEDMFWVRLEIRL